MRPQKRNVVNNKPCLNIKSSPICFESSRASQIKPCTSISGLQFWTQMPKFSCHLFHLFHAVHHVFPSISIIFHVYSMYCHLFHHLLIYLLIYLFPIDSVPCASFNGNPASSLTSPVSASVSGILLPTFGKLMRLSCITRPSNTPPPQPTNKIYKIYKYNSILKETMQKKTLKKKNYSTPSLISYLYTYERDVFI